MMDTGEQAAAQAEWADEVHRREEALKDDPETASAPEDGRWAFNAEVTAAFDDMLARSIPSYPEMRRIVTDAAAWVVDQRLAGGGIPRIIDLGASRGAALAPLVDKLGARARFGAIEVSEPMREALMERFEGMTKAGIFEVSGADLRRGLPEGFRGPNTVVLSVLTLQFIPIEYRPRLLRAIYDSLLPGGALLLVEKVLGNSHEADSLMTDLYYGLKRENGYTQDAIDRKRLSLEGVLVPLPVEANEMFLQAAGFELIETIWAWCNFRAWIALRRAR